MVVRLALDLTPSDAADLLAALDARIDDLENYSRVCGDPEGSRARTIERLHAISRALEARIDEAA